MGQKVRKIIRRAILSADIFQQPVQLKIKKSFGHKTYCGAILTITLIITLSIIVVNNLITLINKTNPSTFQSKFQLEGQNIIHLSPQNFTLQFSLNNPNFQSFVDETVYSVEAWLTRKYTPIVNGTLEYYYERNALPLILCSKQIDQQENMKDYFSKYDLNNNYCLDWSQINQIELMRSDTGEEQYIELKFKYCIDDLKCKPKDKIIEKLNRNYVSLEFSTYNYDFQDYRNPDYPIGSQVYTSVSSKIFKEVFVDLSIMTIQTDDGIIVSDVSEKKSVKYEKFVEMTNYDESNSIVNCILRINDEEIIHYRSYPRLQTMLGEVGGLWSVLFTLGSIILIPIRQLSLQIALVNCLFNFENSKRELAQNDIKTIKKTHLKQTILSSSFKNLKISNLTREISFKIEKDKLDQQIQQSLILFFNTHITKLYIGFIGFIQHLFFRKYKKDMQLDYSSQKMERSLDIVYIMRKIGEIDKLKLLLMSKEQIQMFDYMQRPKIYLDQQSILQKSEEQLYSILREKQTTHQKSELAQKAFDILVENSFDPINTKLLSFIDPNINQLLSMRSNKQQNTSIK